MKRRLLITTIVVAIMFAATLSFLSLLSEPADTVPTIHALEGLS